MVNTETLELLQLSYETVQLIENTGIAIIGNRDENGEIGFGVYNLNTNRISLQPKYYTYNKLDSMIKFHGGYGSTPEIVLYNIYTDNIIELKEGIQETKIIGELTLFITWNHKLIAINTKTGGILYNDTYSKISYQEDNKSGIGFGLIDKHSNKFIVTLDGKIYTLEEYLSKHYKEVYIVENNSYTWLVAIDNESCIYELDETGLFHGKALEPYKISNSYLIELRKFTKRYI